MFLLGNGHLITRDLDKPYLEDGAVAFQNGQIIKVGETKELQEAFPGAIFLNAKKNLIMPGLINIHEHSYSTMARGMSLVNYHPEQFVDILKGLWWKIDRNLSKEQIELSAAITFLDSIRNGITTVFDHHASYGFVKNSLHLIGEQARKCGIRHCLCYEVSDREGEKKAWEAIEENASYLLRCKRDPKGMMAGMMGLHASFTLSDETLRQCKKELPDGCGVHIHTAEGAIDQEECLRKYRLRVIERLNAHGLLGPYSIAAHCIDLNEHERELLKMTGTCIAYNPESNMGNAVGCPDMIDFVRRGIIAGVGTDGFCHDLLESYKTGVLLLKHESRDTNVAFDEMNRMLYQNNAMIASRHFNRKLGVIKKGYAADLIVVEYHPITNINEENFNAHLFYGVSGKDVVTTICNGRVLMENKRLLFTDTQAVYEEARKEADKLWKAMA